MHSIIVWGACFTNGFPLEFQTCVQMCQNMYVLPIEYVLIRVYIFIHDLCKFPKTHLLKLLEVFGESWWNSSLVMCQGMRVSSKLFHSPSLVAYLFSAERQAVQVGDLEQSSVEESRNYSCKIVWPYIVCQNIIIFFQDIQNNMGELGDVLCRLKASLMFYHCCCFAVCNMIFYVATSWSQYLK